MTPKQEKLFDKLVTGVLFHGSARLEVNGTSYFTIDFESYDEFNARYNEYQYGETKTFVKRYFSRHYYDLAYGDRREVNIDFCETLRLHIRQTTDAYLPSVCINRHRQQPRFNSVNTALFKKPVALQSVLIDQIKEIGLVEVFEYMVKKYDVP